MTTIKNISIPSPCTQSWNNMTANGVGRHCGACAKTVVDFSAMSTNEIINYLTANTNVCGRFEEKQFVSVNSQLLQAEPHSFNQWKGWGVALGILTSLSYFKANAQIKEATTQVADSSSQRSFPLGKVAMLSLDRTITGCVTDEHGLPIPGAMISNTSHSKSAVTNAMGKFTLQLADNDMQLKVSFIGYEQQTININKDKTQQDAIMMQPSLIEMGEVVIVQQRPGVFKRIKHWLKLK